MNPADDLRLRFLLVISNCITTPVVNQVHSQVGFDIRLRVSHLVWQPVAGRVGQHIGYLVTDQAKEDIDGAV